MDVEGNAAPGSDPNGVDVAAGSTAAPAVSTPPADEDPADRELRLAEEALSAAGKPAATAPEAAPAKANPAEPEAAEPESGKPPATVPVAVARAERERRQKAEQEAAYLRGKVEALEAIAQAKPGSQPAEPAKTPEQRLAEIRAERFSLADKYDNGEIKTRDWEEQRTALEDEERQIRESQSRPQSSAQPVQDLTLEERTAQLETQYPVLTSLTKEDLDPLVSIAYREAAREGKPIQSGAAGTLDLRTRVAQIATRLHGQPQPAATNQPGATGGTKPAVSAAPAAPALAETHPIDAGTLGGAGSSGGVSDAEVLTKLNSMTLEEQADYLATQPALVQRVMGRAAL